MKKDSEYEIHSVGHVECECHTELVRIEASYDTWGPEDDRMIWVRWFEDMPHRRRGLAWRWRLRCAWRGLMDGEMPAELALTQEKAAEMIRLLHACLPRDFDLETVPAEETVKDSRR
jgi:hypothetical protein